MNRKQLYDEAFDALLRCAAPQAERKLMEQAREDEDITYSPSHQKAMEGILRKLRRERRRKKLLSYTRRAAVFLLAAAVVSGIGIASVEAWRNKVFNMVLQFQSDHAQVSFEEKQEIVEAAGIQFGYIPEGYSVQENNSKELGNDRRYISLHFADGQGGSFSFSQNKIGGTMKIDTENAEVKPVEINGCQGVLSIKDTIRILVWHDNEYIYAMDGNITAEELLKIARNIRFGQT